MHTHQPSFEDTLERLKLGQHSHTNPMSKQLTTRLPREILLGYDEDDQVQSFQYENSFTSQMLKCQTKLPAPLSSQQTKQAKPRHCVIKLADLQKQLDQTAQPIKFSKTYSSQDSSKENQASRSNHFVHEVLNLDLVFKEPVKRPRKEVTPTSAGMAR